jgi:hypothetical protein
MKLFPCSIVFGEVNLLTGHLGKPSIGVHQLVGAIFLEYHAAIESYIH